MYRKIKFTARFSVDEQALLVHLAARLHRTKSDTIRILIYEKAEELGLLPEQRLPYQYESYPTGKRP